MWNEPARKRGRPIWRRSAPIASRLSGSSRRPPPVRTAALRGRESSARDELAGFVESYAKHNDELFNSHLYSRSTESPLRIGAVAPAYTADADAVDGRVVLLRCVDGE